MKNLLTLALSAMLILSSCGTNIVPPNATTDDSPMIGVTVSKPETAAIEKAKSILKSNVSSQEVSTPSIGEIDWETAQVVNTDYTTAISAKTSDGKSTVVIGVSEDPQDQFVGMGNISYSPEGNIVITSYNVTAGSKSVTVLSPDGKTVISETRTSDKGNDLTSQATCAELREDVADARESAQDAAIDAGLAVAACVAGCVMGGVPGMAVGAATMAWMSYKAMREDKKYHDLKRSYSAKCA